MASTRGSPRTSKDPVKREIEQSIAFWLTVTTQAYQRAASESMAPHGITYRQAMVIGCLMYEGELSQVELAAKMMVEPPTLVRILDRMARDGFISRHPSATDRRKNIVRLTPAAGPIWDTIRQCMGRIRSQATRGLKRDELATLKGLLNRLYQNIEGQAPPGTPPP